MKSCFITGTDTGVGKTIICGLLARFFLDRGYSVITQKWIQTGSRDFSEDIALHLKFMGKGRKDIKDYLGSISPYIFNLASSPHLAAETENAKIDIKRIEKSFRFLSEKFDFVIVEGIGGALVPFNRKRLVIDIAKKLSLPVVIVADNKLGAINHTLLTIEAIKKRKMKIIGIIFNNTDKNRDKIILRDNPKIVRQLSKERILGILPYSKNREALYKPFLPIGDRIEKHH